MNFNDNALKNRARQHAGQTDIPLTGTDYKNAEYKIIKPGFDEHPKTPMTSFDKKG